MLVLERFNQSYYSRGLKFKYSKDWIYSIITFRYPYQHDSEEFLQKVIEFIVDKLTNYNLEITKCSTTFYIELRFDKLEFTDAETFKANEMKYIRHIGGFHMGRI